ncbi:tat pathway signal sequence [Botrytis cinerea]
MAIPNPFRRNDENTRHAWGHTFQWTPDHFTKEQMHPMKSSYDVLAEECLNRLDNISPPTSGELPRNQSTIPKGKEGEEKPKRDLYVLLKEHASEDGKLGELWNEVNTIPDWVDWAQIERGQEVFYRYGGAVLTGLAYQSLLGGMGAARVTEVLARTGGFSTKSARRRMFETTQLLLQVTQSLEAIKPGGIGHISSIKVRLLHAAVRRRILALAKEKPSYYSISDHGIPINDLDSIATIGTFSATLIWLSLPRQGIFLRPQEIADYIALWRLVAHYLGTPTSFFETPTSAKAIMESLLLTEINPSPTSQILAQNIILSLQNQAPAYPSRSFLEANARWLNGHLLCDALGLSNPPLYYYILVAGQCIFYMAISYLYRSINHLDRKQIVFLRRVLPMVIHSPTVGIAGETGFELQYVPEFSTKTELGEYVQGEENKGGVERRNLKAFGLAVVGVGVGSWVVWKGLRGLVMGVVGMGRGLLWLWG